MFKKVKESFPEREERVLKLWNEKKIFERSLEQRSEGKRFSFYDGPPFATGLPHYGHLLAGIIKDVVPRYWAMKGFHVERRFGWDCHGLPVENEIEKTKGLSGAHEIEEYGIANFNEDCRSVVLRYTQEWKETVHRIGRWVDFDRTYHTMDPTYMETLWWVFKQLYDQGLVYQGYKVMAYSAKLGTPLSNFEAGENYKDVDDPSLTLMMPLVEEPDTSVLVWTTTPWTLVSNLACALGSGISYVKIYDNYHEKKLLLAEDRLATYFKEDQYEILERYTAEELAGREYIPPFSYFLKKTEEGAFRLLVGDFVSIDEGTGVVHCAPAFGEDDFLVCRRAGISPVCPVDSNCRFTSQIPEYEGQFVKDADKDIIARLKNSHRILHQGTIRHRYPFCYRSDTPLIYRAVDSWFIAVERIREKIQASNQQIRWNPSHIKEGRFGKWLENARDWAFSRNRYWGTPIPIWKAEDGDVIVIGSLDELEEFSGKRVDDLHRHFVDDITIEKDGKTYHRIPEVFDCWYESGSMPYAQNHYPFENKEKTETSFPADFIAEGLDQTRGWFYTLTVLATALFEKPAFKNVIVNGIILAESGVKMSKRLKNYPEPKEVLDSYGADAIRLYMLHSAAVKGEDLRFSKKGVELVLRQILIPLWSAFDGFFATYADIYGWDPKKDLCEPKLDIDRWILSMVNGLVESVENAMQSYQLDRAVEPFVGFIDQLTNWYIRRNRRRFWNEEASEDRNQAFSTLYMVLLKLSKVAAPFTPFISDALYLGLTEGHEKDSVHLVDFPTPCPTERDLDLERSMAAVQVAVNLGHSLRKEHKVKVRQPLRRAHVISADLETFTAIERGQELIADELNVKELALGKREEDFVTLRAKPNFKTLGRKLGKLMKAAQSRIAQMSVEEFQKISDGESISIELEGETVTLQPEDVEVDRLVKEGLVAQNRGNITVVLETELDDELKEEGLARELVNKISFMRREQGFEVQDRIVITLSGPEAIQNCFKKHGDYIQSEVLAMKVEFAPCEGQEWDLNGHNTTIEVQKA